MMNSRQLTIVTLIVVALLLLFCHGPRAGAQAPRGAARAADTTICRTKTGRICRSTTELARFKRLTGFPKGRPGWVIDHMHPLECGGVDSVWNMQWQPLAESRVKDKIEGDCTRWVKKGAR